MIKGLLYLLIIYLGYQIFKFVSRISITGNAQVKKTKKEDSGDYSKLNIQDAEFEDLEDDKQ